MLFLLFGLLLLDIILIKRNTVFAPWSITLLVWTVELFMYVTVDHGLDSTVGWFELALFLWITSFVSSSYFVASNLPIKNGIVPVKTEYNNKIFKWMFIIAILLVPITVYKTYSYAMANGPTDNVFFNLRYTATQDEEYDAGIFKYVSYIAIVALYAECNSAKINKIKLCILYILSGLLAFSTMAKTTLFVSLIGSFLILIWNRKVKTRILGVLMVLFLGLTVIFSGLRSSSGDTENVDAAKILSVYTLSPIVAFDKEADNTHNHNLGGEKTFRFFYQVANKLGVNVDVDNTVQPFINVPYSTNVYTIFYQYYKDFGFLGIFIFGLINGFIYSFIYSKINIKPAFRIMYAYCAVTLILQFFNEIFWVTFSIVIQVWVLSLLVYYNHERVKSSNNMRLV